MDSVCGNHLVVAGLPHSEIPGSKPICGYPRLIAACRVLHRLSVPRHPSRALSVCHQNPSVFAKKTQIFVFFTFGKSYFHLKMPHPHFSAHSSGRGTSELLSLQLDCLRSPPSIKSKDLQKKSPVRAQTQPIETGGRTWTRTRDFILIRDAL